MKSRVLGIGAVFLDLETVLLGICWKQCNILSTSSVEGLQLPDISIGTVAYRNTAGWKLTAFDVSYFTEQWHWFLWYCNCSATISGHWSVKESLLKSFSLKIHCLVILCKLLKLFLNYQWKIALSTCWEKDHERCSHIGHSNCFVRGFAAH